MLARLIKGDPSFPPLIFLHGFLGCKEDWKRLFPAFEDKYYCIALDLPGRGASVYCEDVLSAIKQELNSLNKPILIGYSMGGRIAMQLRELAHALVNISGHPGLTTEEEKKTRLISDTTWSEKLCTLSFEDFLKLWYAQGVFGSYGRSLLKRRKLQNPCTQDLSKIMLKLSLGNQTLIDDFPRPSLFIYGENDWKYHTLFSKLSRDVYVQAIPNCGHAVHIENPADCSKTILNWLNTHANT